MALRRKTRITVYLDPLTDAAILTWLQAQSNQSEAVRLVLHRSVLPESTSGQSGPGPPLDLAELRQVVETAVASGLARFQLQPAAITPPDAAVQTALDDLAEALLLD